MSRLMNSLALIWKLANPYFFSSDRKAGRLLLAAVIAIERRSLSEINRHSNESGSEDRMEWKRR